MGVCTKTHRTNLYRPSHRESYFLIRRITVVKTLKQEGNQHVTSLQPQHNLILPLGRRFYVVMTNEACDSKLVQRALQICNPLAML